MTDTEREEMMLAARAYGIAPNLIIGKYWLVERRETGNVVIG